MEAQRQSVASRIELSGSRHCKISGKSFACAKRADAWFDIRVIYVRLSSCCMLENGPDCLTIVFPSRSTSTALEVNGGRIPSSQSKMRNLRRDRVDAESAEATYVTTDNLRTDGDLPFELRHKSGVLVSGIFQRLEKHAVAARKKLWSMECNCAISAGSSFLSNNYDFSPFLEVYVAGSCLGQPIVLNQMVHLPPHRNCMRSRSSLDAIPEDEESGNCGSTPQPQEEEYTEIEKCNDLETFNFLDDACVEGEEAELSWFNAGVRVGMGIGLGMCVGIGIGVGLIIRTYQTTTGHFRRHLL